MGEPLKLFPVQLRQIGVAEIAFQAATFGNSAVKLTEKLGLNVGVGAYDPAQRTLQVFVTAFSGEESGAPNSFRITVVGEFHVLDEAKLTFPIDKLGLWAERNGSAVLMPFLREVVFTISQKSGFAPVLMPLVEVPQFRVAQPPEASGQTAIMSGPAVRISTGEGSLRAP